MNAESLSGATKFPAANDEFIDGSIDIAPNDVVTITVEGELNSQVVGEVTNTVDVTYNGTTKTAEATSTAKIPDLTFTKNADGGALQPKQSVRLHSQNCQ